MIIKVCGMREPDNIRDVLSLNIDLIGFVFAEGSSRKVDNIQVHAGIMPDRANRDINDNLKDKQVKRVGVFYDEMPQTLITQVYNYLLDYIQLNADESPVYIDNLKRTLIPDIAPNIKIIKKLSVGKAEDLERWRDYRGLVDMLLLDCECAVREEGGERSDFSILDSYDGDIPFLLGGNFSPDDAENILRINHPQFAGVDLDSRFESEPAVKDVELLRRFIKTIRNYR
jgi:phosphoribosylanthranilate isomerase